MDESNNDNSFSKYRNNINSSKKLVLPKINKEYLPSHYNIKIFNKISNDKIINQKSKIRIFLTSPKEDEQEKNNIITLNNKINPEEKVIHKILSDKIIINKKDSEEENKNKIFQRNLILKKYMNEAILYRKSYFKRNKIQVGKIFKMPYSYDKYIFQNKNLDEDKIFIEPSINNSRLNQSRKVLKKFRTLDKNIELDNINEYFKPNLKKLNCNLKYKYYKNQMKINEINTILDNLHDESRAIFDGYRNQAYNIIDKASPKKE